MKNDKYAGLGNLVKKTVKKRTNSRFNARRSQISPNDIMLSALQDVYGVEPDKEKLAVFMKAVVTLLSALATNGTEQNLFGNDMNDFFSIYVHLVNLCGQLKTVLDENGIDFDINGEEGENEV